MVAKESVKKTEEIEGYRGDSEINQLLDFIEPSSEQRKKQFKKNSENKKPKKEGKSRNKENKDGNYSEDDQVELRKQEKANSIGVDDKVQSHNGKKKRSR